MAKKKAGVEGSGFNYMDAVKVQDVGKVVNGHVVAFHAGGKRVDVRIDQTGHSFHGYTKTYATEDVKATKAEKAAEAESES